MNTAVTPTPTAPTSAIHFDPDTRAFVLRMDTSFYALRVLPDGQVVHVGAGPLPPGTDFAPGHLDDYGDPDFVWEQQGRRWELPTFGDVTYHDVALKVSFPVPPGPLAPGDAPNLPVRDLRLRYEGHEVRTDAGPGLSPTHGQAPRDAGPRETLCLRLRDTGYDFRVLLFYRVTPARDVVERWVTLENGTGHDVAVECLAFGTLHLPDGCRELTRTAGTWAREFIPVCQELAQGRTVLEGRGLNTGHAANPFFLLSEPGRATEDAGTVFFGALAYSGNWGLCFEVLPTDAVRVHGGYEASDFALTLAPGESHTTPAMLHGCSADGRGGASRRLHGFLRDRVLPGGGGAGAFRPVLYNSWEAAYFDLSLENQTLLARRAAALGVELFCVDDGWFGGRRSDRAGLGDWTVSADVFPDGLGPLIREVQGLGMRFGLWVEPEMVSPDSDLYRAHPDWALHFPGRPRPEARNQLILDFGRPEVVAHIHAALDALLREYDITFFKWDMNRYAMAPGSVAGRAVWRAHVAGVYGIMDRLRRTHPGLEIQSCSGGGGRIDAGILGRTDQVWTSDNTDALDRVLIQDGFSLAYPPRVMESWVTHEANHQTGRLSSLDLRFDVAMRGALGIGSALDRLSGDELAAYARKIAFYKRLRPVVQGGDLYRLGVGTAGGDPGVSVWQTVLADGSRAVLSAVVTRRLQGLPPPPPRLRALTPGASYAVRDEDDRDLGLWGGLQLMTLGLPAPVAFGDAARAVRSRTLLLERVSATDDKKSGSPLG